MSPAASTFMPKPIAGPTPRKSCYRRSTTTKAPRKRTFLVKVEKCSALETASTFSFVGHNVSAACAAVGAYNVCLGGNDGNITDGRGNNGKGNGGNRWDASGSGDFEQPAGRQPVSITALVGAMALSFGILAPLPTVATEASQMSGSAGRSLSAGCKGPVSVPLRSATLVIPNAPQQQQSQPSLARRSVPDSIQYGTCDISKDERRGLARSQGQFQAREAVRVQ